MKHVFTLFTISISLLSFAQPINCHNKLIEPGGALSNYCEDGTNNWELILEENFSGTSLNGNIWDTDLGWGTYNNGVLYQPQNVTVSGGELLLQIDQTNVIGKGIPGEDDNTIIQIYPGYNDLNLREWECTSGMIQSKRYFKYGKFEIRCKLPDGSYYFPAFWLYGGPNYNEIDIFEFKNNYSTAQMNLYHLPDGTVGEREKCQKTYNPIFQGKFSGEWHTYSAIWDPYKIYFYVDNQLVHSIYHWIDENGTPILTASQYQWTEDDGLDIYYKSSFPTRPMKLIANMSVSEQEESSVIPAAMQVDYIKVWSQHPELNNLDIESQSGYYQVNEKDRFPPQGGVFESIVDYINTPDNSEYADGQGGDLNGDGIEEFVSVRNLDGEILIHSMRVDPNPQGSGKLIFWKDGGWNTAGYNSNWAGVTCGDIDGDGKDEIIAMRNLDANVIVWDVDYTPVWWGYGQPQFTMTHKCSYTTAGLNSDWSGIECGDFDGDGIDELAIMRNLDDKIFFWEYNDQSNSLEHFATYTAGGNTQFADLTAGDFNGDGKDEVAVVRNWDGLLFILDLDPQNIPYVRLSRSHGPNSDWSSITAGDYKGQGYDQILCHRNFDNKIVLYDAINTVDYIDHDFPCTKPVALGSVKFDENPCEGFVYMNNLGEYELKTYPGFCFGKPGSEGSSNMKIQHENSNLKNTFKVVPNPATNIVNVTFVEPIVGDLALYSAEGKLVYSKTIDNCITIPIDIQKFNIGVYFVHITTSEGLIQIEKLIIR